MVRSTKKRARAGDGCIRERRPGSWEVRFYVNGQVQTCTVRGTKDDAKKKLIEKQHNVNTGEHVDSDRVTVAAWVEHWLSIGAPGRRGRPVSPRSLERYGQYLRVHVLPTLGAQRLQALPAAAIDKLYVDLKKRMAPRTLSLVHATFGACLNCAVRTGKLARSPMSRLASTPTPGGEANHGVALEQDELRRLLQGFQDSVIYPIVVTLALTGARRSEVLALRWTDFDPAKKTLRIERAIEDSPDGLRLKPPKTKRGVRTVALNDELVKLLLAEREKHLCYTAGVPEGTDADLRLVRLPPEALIFPSSGSLTSLRHPDAVSLLFRTHARRLGFKIRLHDLRGSHATALLIAGHPPHAVAARIGDTVAVLLASYAKHVQSADDAMVASVGEIAKAVL